MKQITYLLLFALISTPAMSQGDFTWAITDNYTGQHDNYVFDLAIDKDNNLVSVGRSSKSSGSDNQLIIYKHDSDGNEIWETTFNYQQYISDAEIEVADNYDIVVVAGFRGDITVGAETYNAANSQEDIVLIKMDSTGAVLWSAHDGRTNGGEGVEGLTIDTDGNVYYAGKYSPFTSYVGTDTLTNGPGAFLAAYDSDGTYNWHAYISVGLESVAASSNHIYAYGNTSPAGYNTVGDSIFTSASYGSYIAKFNFDGSLAGMSFEHDVIPREVIVTPDDRVMTTGFFNTAGAVVAGDTISPVTASIDSYLGRYDLDLVAGGAFQVSASDYTNGVDIAASSNGHYALLGQFAGDLTFAGSTITDASGYPHQIFVMEFDENDAEVEVYHISGTAASTATEIEEAAISAGSNGDFYVNGYLKGRANCGTIDLNPGGNKIHAFLGQIGEAGALTVEAATQEIELEVYPNPFSHELNIAIGETTSGNLKLIDISGRVVYVQQLTDQNTTISVRHLVSGTYMLDVELKGGKRLTQKVILL